MLPERGGVLRADVQAAHDGRYADTAMALLLKEMVVIGAPYKEYQVKLFGGSTMFPKAYNNRMSHINIQNVQAARRLVKQHGFSCVAEHLGGIGPRNVIFEVWSGDVWVKHRNMLAIAEYKTINRSLR